MEDQRLHSFLTAIGQGYAVLREAASTKRLLSEQEAEQVSEAILTMRLLLRQFMARVAEEQRSG